MGKKSSAVFHRSAALNRPSSANPVGWRASKTVTSQVEPVSNSALVHMETEVVKTPRSREAP